VPVRDEEAGKIAAATQAARKTAGTAMMREMGGKRGEGPKADSMSAPKLFTIGYQTLTPDELVKRLKTAGIERVVDVRELPLSRRRGFSKSPLAATLEKAGIEYQHARELGNPKPTRDRYKSGDIEGGACEYRVHLHNGSYPALIELSESLADVKTCLLCVEASHSECHRAVIAGAVAERLAAVSVVHL
jgi:uncharacterized protein (DUF488 family)